MLLRRRLCAVLACPPTTSGARTVGALTVAAGCLQYSDILICNLLSVPARDLAAMSSAGAAAAPWLQARVDLARSLEPADGLLVAWGVVPPGGPARRHHQQQVEWLVEAAQAAGHSEAWTVGGQPRHPSRWHQFTSDRHGRTPSGLGREDRLRSVLVQVPVSDLCQRPSPRVATCAASPESADAVGCAN